MVQSGGESFVGRSRSLILMIKIIKISDQDQAVFKHSSPLPLPHIPPHLYWVPGCLQALIPPASPTHPSTPLLGTRLSAGTHPPCLSHTSLHTLTGYPAVCRRLKRELS